MRSRFRHNCGHSERPGCSHDGSRHSWSWGAPMGFSSVTLLGRWLLRGCNCQQYVYDEQLPVKVRLHPLRVTVGQLLSHQIHLQALDGSFDAGAIRVTKALSCEMLGMVPVYLRLVCAVDPDLSALPFCQAGT